MNDARSSRIHIYSTVLVPVVYPKLARGALHEVTIEQTDYTD